MRNPLERLRKLKEVRKHGRKVEEIKIGMKYPVERLRKMKEV